MKNIQFLFLLIGSVTLHGVDNKKAVAIQRNNSWQNIDYKAAEKKKEDKHIAYCINRLKGYDKLITHQFSSKDTDDIEQMQMNITNKKDLSALAMHLHKDITNEKGDNFLHSAIEKRDTDCLRWLMDILESPISTPNNKGKEPIDLCIDHLEPNAVAKEIYQQAAHDMLDILTARYDKLQFDRNSRKKFLTAIVQLQLKLIKEDSPLRLKEVLFTRFLTQNSADQEPINIAEIYQEARDVNGNSFTYILIQRAKADMLYSFAQKGYLTFTKNDDEEDAAELKLAEEMFDLYDSADWADTHSGSSNDSGSKSASEIDAACCCYRIILNALKQQHNDTDFEYCCKNHPFKNK